MAGDDDMVREEDYVGFHGGQCIITGVLSINSWVRRVEEGAGYGNRVV
jgi:hypothetical protein